MTDTQPPAPEYLDAALSLEVRKRQKSRARALGIILFGLAALFYIITLFKFKAFG